MPASHLGVNPNQWSVSSFLSNVFFSHLRSKTRSHLEYLHLQVLSVVSVTQLRRIFERRTNFDLGRLLSGGRELRLTFYRQYSFSERIGNPHSFFAG
jgi:hypothetical protein